MEVAGPVGSMYALAGLGPVPLTYDYPPGSSACSSDTSYKTNNIRFEAIGGGLGGLLPREEVIQPIQLVACGSYTDDAER